MRRAAKEITDPAELGAILDEAALLFVSFHDEPAPYVLPLCFGRIGGTLYAHSALEGAKMDLLRARPEVGFSAVAGMALETGATACAYGCAGRSVCGRGAVRVVEDPDERIRGLEAIMRHYDERAPVDFAPGTLSRTCVLAINADSLRGKRVG
jgi:uncharacterized protein